MRTTTPMMSTKFGLIQCALSSVCAFLCLLAVAGNAVAVDTILYDSQGFESPTFSSGSSPVGQDAGNPWQIFGGSPSAYTVTGSVAASGTQSIQANGSGLNDGSYVWPNLGYTPSPNDLVRVQVDMSRTLSAVAADSSPVYAIDVYDFDFNRTTRFGLQNQDGNIRAFVSVPINAGGEIDPAGPGIRSEFYGAPIPAGQFVHFDFVMDYTNKVVSLELNGTVLAYGVPFRTQESTTLDSAELQVGTFNNISSDHGWFDNYIVSTVQNVAGDVNFDHTVDVQDLTLAANNWLQNDSPGDANHDGVVDIQDITLIANNWLQSVPAYQAGAGTNVVPEPGTLVMVTLGGLLLVLARRARVTNR